jgi:hypothetical protein
MHCSGMKRDKSCGSKESECFAARKRAAAALKAPGSEDVLASLGVLELRNGLLLSEQLALLVAVLTVRTRTDVQRMPVVMAPAPAPGKAFST